MRNRGVIVVLVVVFLLILAGLLLAQPSNNVEVTPTPTENPELSPTPTGGTTATPTPEEQVTPSPTGTVSDWDIFQSDEIGIRIRYPQDVRVQTIDNMRYTRAVQFIKFGPTQIEGTEFYDGINVLIDKGVLEEDQSVRSLALTRLEEAKEGPTFENSSEMTTVTVAGRTGYRFTIESLGVHEYTFLPEGQEYIEIRNSTADPTSQGYQETVDQMLATLEIE